MRYDSRNKMFKSLLSADLSEKGIDIETRGLCTNCALNTRQQMLLTAS